MCTAICKSPIINELEEKIKKGNRIIIYDLENEEVLEFLCDAVEIKNLANVEIWYQKADREILSSCLRIITEDEISAILRIYYLYEFSDKIVVLSDKLTYPGIVNYIHQGLMTENEIVEILVR